MLVPNTLLQDRYVVVRRLGQGGMGAVYEATDRRFGSTVAIKEMLVAGPEMQKAFEREARLLNTLRHAALPVVMDYFHEGDGQFLVMQFIPGEDLGQLLARQGRAFPLDRVMRWADQLLSALEYLHSRNPPVLHRDIKPQNLKLTPEGDVVLLDFGLAKGSAGQMTFAAASVAGYTPSYAPLEQMRGQGSDARSDLYSLAATLYHLATGVVPADAVARAEAHVSREADPLRPAHEVNPAVPRPVSDALQWALSLSRNDRPASASALRAALHARGPGAPTVPDPVPWVTATPPAPESAPSTRFDSEATMPRWRAPSGPLPAPQPAPRSKALPIALAAGALLLLGVAGVVAVIVGTQLAQRWGEPEAPPPAEQPQRELPPDAPQRERPGDAPQPPPKPQRVSGGVLAGKAIERPQPVYPQTARAARIEGSVVVEVTVDEEGNVILARAVSGHPLLRDAAVQSARRWKFTPTTLSGVPVKVVGTISFNFKMS
jgi:TonB family protein